jgi:lipopolysaccharide transport system ATP-binding protein
MKSVIRVHNLSKLYRIGARRHPHSTLKETLAGAFRSPLDRFRRKAADSSDRIWALKDVSFEVQPGEVVGVIGRNGAGKSTLLKILSRIVEPTGGRAEIYGRVGSLLEVGTGFHPELTGRENVYLNGAILGMKRREIDAKFDEIVAFAEVEKFLDTPVKRYSSGMYTRLAFAVAANLDPEILIVDEVLSVGDAMFQRKCLGKMEDVAKQGRTVLFVSHQMSAVAQMCSRAILLSGGVVARDGTTQQVVDHYLREVSGGKGSVFTAADQPEKDIFIVKAQALDAAGVPKSHFTHTEPIVVAMTLKINRWVPGSAMGIFVQDHRGRKVFTSNNPEWATVGQGDEEVSVSVTLPAHLLVPAQYSFTFAVSVNNERVIEWLDSALTVTVIDAGSEFSRYEGLDYGCVFADCRWSVEKDIAARI